MDQKSKLILAQYTVDALNILDHSISLYAEGHESFYRVAAAQLRILLCDSNFRHGKSEDISVIPVLLPDLKLQPVDSNGQPQLSASPVDLQTWLDLPSHIEEELTVRQLIRRICDVDGGAHVDIKPLAGLPIHGNTHQWIINLARYLSPLLSAALPEEVGI
jgi:hypothetical protein